METIISAFVISMFIGWIWRTNFLEQPARPSLATFLVQLAVAHAMSAFILVTALVGLLPLFVWMVSGQFRIEWPPIGNILMYWLFLSAIIGCAVCLRWPKTNVREKQIPVTRTDFGKIYSNEGNSDGD